MDSTRLIKSGTAILSLNRLGHHCTRAASCAPWDRRMDTKKCSKCGETKPISLFNRDVAKRDGIRSDCKACQAVSRAAHYRSHRNEECENTRMYYLGREEEKKVKMRVWRDKNRERIATYARIRYHQTPEAMKARRMVRDAKSRGELIPCPCENCGATDKTEAHHDDYSKPLEIRWLCKSCHMRLHGEIRRKEA